MKIEFTDEQLKLLKEIVGEYAEECYQSMFECQHLAIDAEDETIKAEYNSIAISEEARFNEAKALSEYITKYEELFRGL